LLFKCSCDGAQISGDGTLIRLKKLAEYQALRLTECQVVDLVHSFELGKDLYKMRAQLISNVGWHISLRCINHREVLVGVHAIKIDFDPFRDLSLSPAV